MVLTDKPQFQVDWNWGLQFNVFQNEAFSMRLNFFYNRVENYQADLV
jgi:hypothetical protein